MEFLGISIVSVVTFLEATLSYHQHYPKLSQDYRKVEHPEFYGKPNKPWNEDAFYGTLMGMKFLGFPARGVNRMRMGRLSSSPTDKNVFQSNKKYNPLGLALACQLSTCSSFSPPKESANASRGALLLSSSFIDDSSVVLLLLGLLFSSLKLSFILSVTLVLLLLLILLVSFILLILVLLSVAAVLMVEVLVVVEESSWGCCLFTSFRFDSSRFCSSSMDKGFGGGDITVLFLL